MKRLNSQATADIYNKTDGADRTICMSWSMLVAELPTRDKAVELETRTFDMTA